MPNKQLPTRSPNMIAYAGWDPMLNTYFLHIVDTTKDEEEAGRDVLWMGTKPNEVHDLETIDQNYRLFTKENVGLPKDVRTEMYHAANA